MSEGFQIQRLSGSQFHVVDAIDAKLVAKLLQFPVAGEQCACMPSRQGKVEHAVYRVITSGSSIIGLASISANNSLALQ